LTQADHAQKARRVAALQQGQSRSSARGHAFNDIAERLVCVRGERIAYRVLSQASNGYVVAAPCHFVGESIDRRKVSTVNPWATVDATSSGSTM
jgi:hypothetical protein